MNTDFKDASERHFDDGELLLSEHRLANADHLFGLSAECSLKAVMVALGMATGGTGTPVDRGHIVHMPVQWAAFHSFAQGRLASRYLEPLDKQNPFADWQVNQRYWRQDAIPEKTAKNHRKAAIQCQESLEKTFLDGVVT